MGNVCCGASEESKKESAFQVAAHDANSTTYSESGLDTDASLADRWTNDGTLSNISAGNYINANISDKSAASNDITQSSEDANLQLQLLQQEQARLESIVLSAGQRMVAVQSTRGSNFYDDQGFGAALSQILSTTCEFQPLPRELPPATTNTSHDVIRQRLMDPTWQNIQLGDDQSSATNPQMLMDKLAESLLDNSIFVNREDEFRKAGLIVETLT